MSDGYVPPQNLEAESEVLGSMLLGDADVIADAGELIRAKDFYIPSNGAIFDCILDLDAKGMQIDGVTVAAELDRRGWLSKVGGKARIAELCQYMPPKSMIRQHAAIIKEMAIRRGLATAGQTIRHVGISGLGESGALLEQAESALSEVADDTNSSDFSTIGDSAVELADEILQFAEEGKERYGLKTQYPTLDKLTTGLHPGDLTILAARPSVGKSAFVQNISTRVAKRGTGVLFFSLEMSRAQIATRQLSTLTGIPTTQLTLAKLDAAEQEKVRKAAQELKALPIYVEDDSSLRLPELRAKVKRKARQEKIGLLVVDYLQLMIGGDDPESRQNEIATISRGLKVLARELQIPVIALSQLNRKVEQREDKRPMLSDLRDSGAIEQDADMVWMLYRESLYKPQPAETAHDTELLIRKNRMNEPGMVKLTFIKNKELYSEPARTFNREETSV